MEVWIVHFRRNLWGFGYHRRHRRCQRWRHGMLMRFNSSNPGQVSDSGIKWLMGQHLCLVKMITTMLIRLQMVKNQAEIAFLIMGVASWCLKLVHLQWVQRDQEQFGNRSFDSCVFFFFWTFFYVIMLYVVRFLSCLLLIQMSFCSYRSFGLCIWTKERKWFLNRFMYLYYMYTCLGGWKQVYIDVYKVFTDL